MVPGAALRFIGEACAIARTLQPSVVVVEDVELAAESRGLHASLPPPLVRLLTEMEGVGQDADVTFLLTTDRADLLEEALAARPGQIDHAARLPLPDAAARRRLLRLYQGSLRISRPSVSAVVARTDGVNASFIRELLRRAAVYAADGRGPRAAALAEVNALAPATANGSGPVQATGSASGPHNGSAPDPGQRVRPDPGQRDRPGTGQQRVRPGGGQRDRPGQWRYRGQRRCPGSACAAAGQRPAPEPGPGRAAGQPARPDPRAARQPPHARGGRDHPAGAPPPAPHPLTATAPPVNPRP